MVLANANKRGDPILDEREKKQIQIAPCERDESGRLDWMTTGEDGFVRKSVPA